MKIFFLKKFTESRPDRESDEGSAEETSSIEFLPMKTAGKEEPTMYAKIRDKVNQYITKYGKVWCYFLLVSLQTKVSKVKKEDAEKLLKETRAVDAKKFDNDGVKGLSFICGMVARYTQGVEGLRQGLLCVGEEFDRIEKARQSSVKSEEVILI